LAPGNRHVSAGAAEMIEDGYKDFARRWKPILEVFQQADVKFALEVHPGEIAYDFWTTRQALEAIEYHPAFELISIPATCTADG